MSNIKFWLHKMAAFLHDPPYKVLYFGKKYKGQNWGRDRDVIEIFENHIGPAYPFKDPQNPRKIKFRVFHHIAASAGKNHYFGLKGPNIIFDNGGYRFIHSLSGELISLDKFWETPPNSTFDPKSEVENFLKSLKGDEKEKFLNLWRLLPSKITVWVNLLPVDTVLADNTTRDLDVIQSALIAAWNVGTPLDKKEAIKPSFLILEFGPVQKFIADARKTRDLWFSSWLISYLAWKAMKPITEELGPDNIVYPDLYKQPLVDDWLIGNGIKDIGKPEITMPTLPNTFLAIVKEGDEKKYADAAKDALSQSWKDLVESIPNVETIKKSDDGRYLKLKEIWRDMVVNKFLSEAKKFPFEVYWLGLKWGDDPEKAIEDYKKLLAPDKCWNFERLWTHIKKNIKNPNIGDAYELLVQMAQTGLKALKYRGKPEVTNEPGYKCSLCGERTAFTDGDPNDIKGIKKFWKQMADAFPSHIKENEHLCAVCLVKRLAPVAIYQNPDKFFESGVTDFDYHFPSTGSIAIAPFMSRAIRAAELSLPEVQWELITQKISEIEQSPDGDKFFEKYILHGRSVPKIRSIFSDDLKFLENFEPEWMYPETPDREVVEPEKHEEKQRFSLLAEDLGKAIKTAFEDFKKEVPMPKYYAAVFLDGDNLGKWLRGELAPKIEDVFHPDFVKAIYEKDETRKNFERIKDLKRPVTPAIHRAISSALRDFALEVVPYVVEHNLGVVVYSGGDDTLFLMPLENLLDTIITLRKLYSGRKYIFKTDSRIFESDKGFIKIYEKDGSDRFQLKEIIRVMGTRATLSAGVAIAHYLDPLDITLSMAKKVLKDAKNAGRNRAGFKVILHSGSVKEAVVPWDFVEAMEKFKDAVASGFSSRFLRTLYEKIDLYQGIPDAFDAEFLKFGARGQEEGTDLLLCDLVDARKSNNLNPREFIEALLIADFIVREEGAK